MTSQITIHDYQVPEVTFEEADTIARNVFGNSMISPDFVDKIRLIIEDDRAHVADLQDSWVEVPEGATIPEGTLYRLEFPHGGASERISVEPVVPKSNFVFVRKSDCPRLTIPKSRRHRADGTRARANAEMPTVPGGVRPGQRGRTRIVRASGNVDSMGDGMTRQPPTPDRSSLTPGERS